MTIGRTVYAPASSRQRSRLTHLRYGRETGGGTCGKLKRQQTQMDAPSFKKLIADIPQMVYLDKEVVYKKGYHPLSHEECLKDKKKEAANFRHIEEESNKYTASRILQKSGKLTVVVNPPYPL